MRTLPGGFIAPCLPTKTDKLPSRQRMAARTTAQKSQSVRRGKFQGFLSCLFETILFEFFRGETSSRRGSSPTAHVLASLFAAGVCLTLRPGYPARHVGVPIDSAAVRISTRPHVILL